MDLGHGFISFDVSLQSDPVSIARCDSKENVPVELLAEIPVLI